MNSSASRENRYETSFSSSSASGARGVAANSFPRDDDDDDDVEEVVHTVAPGDSLYGVAIAYDVDPRDLIVSNRRAVFAVVVVVVVVNANRASVLFLNF